MNNADPAQWPSDSTGPFLTRLRRRLFGLNAAEVETRRRLFAEMQAQIRAQLERASDCELCLGDGWILDSAEDYRLLANDEERRRFRDRMGVARGAAQGRMSCPRCQA